jgi:hypothetical protein
MAMQRFFTPEAIAAYVIALVSLAHYVYKEWKSRRGRHVVCTQPESEFSHISLSEKAREWVRVEFTDNGQQLESAQIHALSQILIDIKNESNTDALNDVLLKFRIPDARVLKVWWEEGPQYLLERSQLSSSTEYGQSAEEEASVTSQVEISLPQLKSYKKYGEVLRIGILADGDLESIQMLPRGSKQGTPLEQVWTAKFISFEELKRKRSRGMAIGQALGYVFGGLLVLGFLYMRTDSIAARDFLVGFMVAGLVGLLLGRIRLIGLEIYRHMSALKR